MTFDGYTFDKDRDGQRLSTEMARVKAYVLDGEWHTLSEISLILSAIYECRFPESSVSARLRDLRKPLFGGYVVEREYVARGLHRYRVLLPEPVQIAMFA